MHVQGSDSNCSVFATQMLMSNLQYHSPGSISTHSSMWLHGILLLYEFLDREHVVKCKSRWVAHSRAVVYFMDSGLLKSLL